MRSAPNVALSTLSEQIEDCPEMFIFNTLPFYQLHKDTNATYLYIYHNSRPVGAFQYAIDDINEARSPRRGTFGGIQLFSTDIFVIQEVIRQIEDRLKSERVQHIEILEIPAIYEPHVSPLKFASYTRAGFRLKYADIHFAIEVGDHSLNERMARNNRKRFRKGLRNNYVFRQLSMEEFGLAYDVVLRNREHKGWKLSMAQSELIAMEARIPNSLRAFYLTLPSGEPVAAAICVVLNKSVLYVLYWGDIPGNESESPVVYLADAIYKYCQQNKYKYLDLGTSSVEGSPMNGLIEFKLGLGAIPNLKATCENKLR